MLLNRGTSQITYECNGDAILLVFATGRFSSCQFAPSVDVLIDMMIAADYFQVTIDDRQLRLYALSQLITTDFDRRILRSQTTEWEWISSHRDAILKGSVDPAIWDIGWQEVVYGSKNTSTEHAALCRYINAHGTIPLKYLEIVASEMASVMLSFIFPQRFENSDDPLPIVQQARIDFLVKWSIPSAPTFWDFCWIMYDIHTGFLGPAGSKEAREAFKIFNRGLLRGD